MDEKILSQRKRVGALNAIYGIMIGFLVMPTIFPPMGLGFGEFGLGIREQILHFASWLKPDMAKPLMLLINSGVIMLILAVCIAIAFTITTLVIIDRAAAKKYDLNIKLMKTFNIIIFSALSFVFLLTFPYLTFTFICAYILAFYAFFITLKPKFLEDLTDRKSEMNSVAVTFVASSVILALCFGPIYTISGTYDFSGINIKSYNFFTLFTNLFNGGEFGIDSFLVVISLIVFSTAIALNIFSIVRYLTGKTRLFFITNIMLGVGILLSILIGAFINMESQIGSSGSGISLSVSYYALTAAMSFALLVYFVLKMTATKNKEG